MVKGRRYCLTRCQEDGGVFQALRAKQFSKPQIRKLRALSQRLKANKTMPRITVHGPSIDTWNSQRLSSILRGDNNNLGCRFISVKFGDLKGKQAVRQAAELLAGTLEADIVQVIGHTTVLCHGVTPKDILVDDSEAW
eukprot:CAMPEP_0185269464 /NCGR_PEP_ID=MMETSP1359-20130426/39909_1 /TAXON_ID=552665 /ORGANISM="Bigelowiella longifila, Strain CCMP242" /LENGTH=137 /DNA_ID=CAMNT_0027860637 /DNA_START=285 /DNA_END=698 /DNA_ORIENTATION=+